MTSVTPIDRAHGVAKLENGYSRIANELLEALAASPLTPSQWSVVMAVIRMTYGYRKPSATIPTKKIAAFCRITPWLARHAISELLAARVLFREGGQRSPIGVNNHTEEWRFATENVAPSVGKSQHSKKNECVEIPTLSVGKSQHSVLENPNTRGDRSFYIKKENFKEEDKESEKTAAAPAMNSSARMTPEQVVEAWNTERRGHAIPTITPPRLQTQIRVIIDFVAQYLGRDNWPRDADDMPAWFADFFASVESGDQGDYIKARDIGFFMDPDRLFNVVENINGARH